MLEDNFYASGLTGPFSCCSLMLITACAALPSCCQAICLATLLLCRICGPYAISKNGSIENANARPPRREDACGYPKFSYIISANNGNMPLARRKMFDQ